MKYSQEHWVKITEYQGHKFDGRYEVSDWGNVRNVETKQPLAQYSDNRGQGYMRVKIYDTKHVRTAIKIHRLVALNFVLPGGPDQTEINHRDGNVKNNSWTNLEWCTHAENMRAYGGQMYAV